MTLLVFAVPTLYSGFRNPPDDLRSADGSGSQHILDHLMSAKPILNFMGADLQHKIGLDRTKCMQKTICEAHRSPREYGLLGGVVRMLWP